jgi:hypothetical protein
VHIARRPLTAEDRFRSQASPCEICGGQCGSGTDFSPKTSVFPCQLSFHHCSILSSSTCCSYQKDKRAKPGNLPESNALSEMGKYRIQNTGISHLSVSLFGTTFRGRSCNSNPFIRLMASERPVIDPVLLLLLLLLLFQYHVHTSKDCDRQHNTLYTV